MMYSHSCGEVRLIDGDGDAAGHDDADVAVEPLGARVGQDARALALADAQRQQTRGDLARALVPLGPRRRAPAAALLPPQDRLVRRCLDALVEHHHAVLHAERPLGRFRRRNLRRRRHRCLHGLQFLREGRRAFNRMVLCETGRNEQRTLRIPRTGDFCAGAVRAGALLRRLDGAARDVSAQSAAAGVVRPLRGRAVPRARGDVRQGRADHVDAPRSVSAAPHRRAGDAAGQRGAVRLRARAAHVHRRVR